MNQNNMNDQSKMNLSPEELQRTQVINLKDVEEAVRIEKRTSKKPAIIFCIMGLVLLAFGSSVQIMTSLKEKKQEERIIEQREEEMAVSKTKINCTQTKLNSNGVDNVYSFTYYFEDDKLVKEVKMVSSVPTPGKNNGATIVKKNKEEFKKYLNNSPGYNIALTETETGFSVTTEIDYKELDATKLNSIQKNSLVTSVDYKDDVLESTIKDDMTKKKFTCQ